jgi:hypothetical protein
VLLNFNTGANAGMCSGTLITNQHVLTARHCVQNRASGSWTTFFTGMTVTIEGLSGVASQTIPVSLNAFVPTGTAVIVPADDYAVLQLDLPVTVTDADEAQTAFVPFYLSTSSQSSHFVEIYRGTQAALVNQGVVCVGYGNNTQAVYIGPGTAGTGTGTGGATTVGTATIAQQLSTANYRIGAGSGTQRWASNIVVSAAAETFTVGINAASQVAASGDSGGTCYWFNSGSQTWEVTGVVSGGNGVPFVARAASTTPGAPPVTSGGAIDINGDGTITSDETTNRTNEVYAAPWDFTAFVDNIIRADVSVDIRHVPAASSAVELATLINPGGSQVVFLSGSSGRVTGTGSDAGVRSGFITAKGSEPAKMMCPIMHSVVPLTGNVSLKGTCLGDGLVHILL